ncbi:MAG: thioredoxin domain-containing protein, partial [Bacteroidia bacterium]|nr:thioredoxin domain-containing protein [Bacteroidia bacterium]
VHLSLTDKLCHLNKATNCNTVLNDKASKVFGWFGWADTGFVYFTSCLLFLVQRFNEQGLSMLAFLSALSLPYPLFSIYYQGFVLKKWCPMCLGVQLILIIEFIILLPRFSQFSFSFNALSGLILTFLIIGIIYTLFILFLKEKMSNEMHYYRYLGFKKNPDILRTLLLNQTHYDIPVKETSLVFGDKDARFKITAFLSLHCSHCARAFEKIKNILKSGEKVLINLVLITSDTKIINSLYEKNMHGKTEESLNLLDQWFNADPYSRTKITEGICIPEDGDILNKVNEENSNLFKDCNVIGTPTFFVNGFLLPGQYDINDLKYFMEVFKEKEEYKHEKIAVK